ncbi:unnamed protein product [Cyprideis torosa]|uniref:Delta(3,5)-Delta(2,4)-dienoyl-CoA isomerase, mitochondrial n=1 Tax=Cyprideis torosa TaxID=163714 RepID=A0A7R8ZMR1_9CRUS|nr:unnamed protein product [Cyprideis torosa]CAG0886153.1 unnamed protein product [Cyprideis torosa]
MATKEELLPPEATEQLSVIQKPGNDLCSSHHDSTVDSRNGNQVTEKAEESRIPLSNGSLVVDVSDPSVTEAAKILAEINNVPVQKQIFSYLVVNGEISDGEENVDGDGSPGITQCGEKAEVNVSSLDVAGDELIIDEGEEDESESSEMKQASNYKDSSGKEEMCASAAAKDELEARLTYSCELCDQGFPSFSSLRGHHLSEHYHDIDPNADSPLYQCANCSFSSDSREKVTEHQMIVHHSPPTDTESALAIVKRQLHAAKGGIFACEICSLQMMNSIPRLFASRRCGLRREFVSSFRHYNHLSVTQHEHVFLIELNRPAKKNALNLALWGEIGTCFRELGEESSCRSIILSAKGDTFSAGIDLGELMKLGATFQDEERDSPRKALRARPTIVKFQNDFTALELCGKPVIAAIHGACIGAATNMITCVDIRYASKSAWFQIKETKLGFAADVGVLQRLPKIIGNHSLMNEWALTGRKISAEDALTAGLVSAVFDDKDSLLQRAMDVAQEIAENSPVATRVTKEALLYARDHSVQDSLDQIASVNSLMLQSEDVITAAVAMVSGDKEKPRFKSV